MGHAGVMRMGEAECSSSHCNTRDSRTNRGKTQNLLNIKHSSESETDNSKFDCGNVLEKIDVLYICKTRDLVMKLYSRSIKILSMVMGNGSHKNYLWTMNNKQNLIS